MYIKDILWSTCGEITRHLICHFEWHHLAQLSHTKSSQLRKIEMKHNLQIPVITAHIDGVAPLDARTPSGLMMENFTNTGLVLE